MTVTVTQEHIDKGMKRNCRLCPIALSIWEAMPELYDLKVQGSGITLFAEDSFRTFDLSQEAYRWLVSYDASGFVEPITFEAKEI